MKMLAPHVKAHQSICSCPLIPKTKKPSIIMSLPISPQTHKIMSASNGGCRKMKLQQQQQPWRANGQLAPMSSGAKCCKSGGGAMSELEEDTDEIVLGEELIQMLGKLEEKCKEMKGIAEQLECLEREAIMGEDEGKEPTDYNRRAQIFDKSSRLFQALKERNMDTITTTTKDS